MKHFIKFSLLNFIILVGCVGQSKKVAESDTTKIFNAIYASPKIDDHLVPKNIDSVFMIKNKLYNKSWPINSGRFRFNYIDDSEKARESNPLNLDKLNKKIRVLVPVFSIKNDSAKVVLFNFNFGSSLTYTLKRSEEKWLIVNVSKGMD